MTRCKLATVSGTWSDRGSRRPGRPLGLWLGVWALCGLGLNGFSEPVQAQVRSTTTSSSSSLQTRTSGTSAFSGSQTLGGQTSGGSLGSIGQGMSSVGQVSGSEFYVQGSQASSSFIGAAGATANNGFIGANTATGQGQTGMTGRNTRTGQTGLGQTGFGQQGMNRQGTQFGTGQFGGQFGNNQFGNRNNQFGNQQNRQFNQFGGAGRSTTSYRPRLTLGFTPPAADVQTATQTLQVQATRIGNLPIFSSEGNNVALETQGRKVVLTGTVPTEDQRRLFERLVKLEPGVAEIDNQIEVVPAAQ